MPSRRSFLASAAAVAAVPASAPAAPGPDAVSVALMGCGGMGTNHLRLLAANPRVRITHVCDADANRLAAAAKIAADAAVATADEAATMAAAELAVVDAERAEIQRRLDAAVAADAGLRQQRARFEDWQAEMAALQAARDRADQQAARDRAGDRIDPGLRGGAAIERVIDRAMSQVGVQYVWGGGSGRGPTRGIPDRFGSPLNRVGFDCSGLMLYAFSGVGINLPRVSRNQFHAGHKVPISELRPGDMVFFKNGSAPIHHVALYIGDGKMIEAPYTGANVRVVPLRHRGLLPQATRML